MWKFQYRKSLVFTRFFFKAKIQEYYCFISALTITVFYSSAGPWNTLRQLRIYYLFLRIANSIKNKTTTPHGVIQSSCSRGLAKLHSPNLPPLFHDCTELVSLVLFIHFCVLLVNYSVIAADLPIPTLTGERKRHSGSKKWPLFSIRCEFRMKNHKKKK